tara:strand:+ start:65 stop:316 length:252 start_codon:yes stop_codon:yes gene_type:complete
MQIQSERGSVVIDYYPVKTWDSKNITDKFLRVLTFKGRTMTKRVVSSFQMGDEILHRMEGFNYAVTDNKKGFPQFVSNMEDLG